MVNTGLVMSKHLQDELVKEVCESSGTDLNECNKTNGNGPEELLEDTTAIKDGTNDADDHSLRDTSQGDNFAGNAAGSNPKELDKEAKLGDVTMSTLPRRTQHLRMKTRKASELNFCDF